MAKKTEWIKNNKPYVVLWFKVSRVAPYYWTYFNHWHPREDTRFLDIDCCQEPDGQWNESALELRSLLFAQGFSEETSELLCETVPDILTYGGSSIPDDDPRWNDVNFEPSPVLATVDDCLFGRQ